MKKERKHEQGVATPCPKQNKNIESLLSNRRGFLFFLTPGLTLLVFNFDSWKLLTPGLKSI